MKLSSWSGFPYINLIIPTLVARRFSQVLRRQTSLNHLCQAARTVVHSPEITSQMLDDWCNVDLSSIVKQTLYTMDSYSDREHNVIVKCKLSLADRLGFYIPSKLVHRTNPCKKAGAKVELGPAGIQW